MRRRRGPPRPSSPPTHALFLIVVLCPPRRQCQYFLLRFLSGLFLLAPNPMTRMSRRRGLPCPPSPTTLSLLFFVPRRPQCMPFFLLSYFVRGAANVSIFLLRFLAVLRRRCSIFFLTMSRRRGLPRPPSPTTHIGRQR
jgi:hypothetical protein